MNSYIEIERRFMVLGKSETPTLGWDDLLAKPAVLLIATSLSGKTQDLKALGRDRPHATYLELADCADKMHVTSICRDVTTSPCNVLVDAVDEVVYGPDEESLRSCFRNLAGALEEMQKRGLVVRMLFATQPTWGPDRLDDLIRGACRVEPERVTYAPLCDSARKLLAHRFNVSEADSHTLSTIWDFQTHADHQGSPTYVTQLRRVSSMLRTEGRWQQFGRSDEEVEIALQRTALAMALTGSDLLVPNLPVAGSSVSLATVLGHERDPCFIQTLLSTGVFRVSHHGVRFAHEALCHALAGKHLAAKLSNRYVFDQWFEKIFFICKDSPLEQTVPRRLYGLLQATLELAKPVLRNWMVEKLAPNDPLPLFLTNVDCFPADKNLFHVALIALGNNPPTDAVGFLFPEPVQLAQYLATQKLRDSAAEILRGRCVKYDRLNSLLLAEIRKHDLALASEIALEHCRNLEFDRCYVWQICETLKASGCGPKGALLWFEANCACQDEILRSLSWEFGRLYWRISPNRLPPVDWFQRCPSVETTTEFRDVPIDAASSQDIQSVLNALDEQTHPQAAVAFAKLLLQSKGVLDALPDSSIERLATLAEQNNLTYWYPFTRPQRLAELVHAQGGKYPGLLRSFTHHELMDRADPNDHRPARSTRQRPYYLQGWPRWLQVVVLALWPDSYRYRTRLLAAQELARLPHTLLTRLATYAFRVHADWWKDLPWRDNEAVLGALRAQCSSDLSLESVALKGLSDYPAQMSTMSSLMGFELWRLSSEPHSELSPGVGKMLCGLLLSEGLKCKSTIALGRLAKALHGTGYPMSSEDARVFYDHQPNEIGLFLLLFSDLEYATRCMQDHCDPLVLHKALHLLLYNQSAAWRHIFKQDACLAVVRRYWQECLFSALTCGDLRYEIEGLSFYVAPDTSITAARYLQAHGLDYLEVLVRNLARQSRGNVLLHSEAAKFVGSDVPLRFKIEGQEYFVTSQLAETGHSFVYLAHDKQNHQYVIKQRRCPNHDTALEAKMQKKVSDASKMVPTVIACSPADGLIVMEYIEGRKLSAADRTLVPNQSLVWTFLDRMLDFVSLTRELGVTHRDLNGSNIFLRGDLLENPVVLDFGLAQYSDLPTNHGVGTRDFIPPDVNNGEAWSEKADVFQLGRCVEKICDLMSQPEPEYEKLKALASEMLDDDPARRPTVAQCKEKVDRGRLHGLL